MKPLSFVSMPTPGCRWRLITLAGHVELAVRVQEGANPRQEVGRPERPTGVGGHLAVAHLRDEAGVRAKPVADVAVHARTSRRERCCDSTAPGTHARQRLPRPLVRERGRFGVFVLL